MIIKTIVIFLSMVLVIMSLAFIVIILVCLYLIPDYVLKDMIVDAENNSNPFCRIFTFIAKYILKKRIG